MTNSKISSILIVGGGSAGWLTAGIIAARHGQSVKISLLESSTLPTIGVGEGTWPTMKTTLQKMGISETEFFRYCDVSFKQGAKFCQWVTGKKDDFYYHPLTLPKDFLDINLAPFWLENPSDSFSNSVSFQEAICEKNLAPKTLLMPEYAAAANYAYHLDAGKLTEFLSQHCQQKLNVQHIIGTVDEVLVSEQGDINSVKTQDGQSYQADLFIDCTGMSSLLLGKALNTEFVDKSDVLFIDRAIATQVPYESEESPILPYTLSTAQSAGWIWDIGLTSRRGAGHVYSSRHISDDQALKQFSDYLGKPLKETAVKEIKIPCGHRKEFWKHNCVAVGMAAGFLEPLEASALVLVELSANYIRDQLPENKAIMPIIAKRFNQLNTHRWNSIVDFLKLHYVLSKRTDSQFWCDNRDPQTIPDSLQELLQLWQYQSPYMHDFLYKEEVFPAASYQYVLYGMGFDTQAAQAMSSQQRQRYTQSINENQQIKQKALNSLPDNRTLLNKIKTFGMKAI
ncbi:tryptophan halogenase family protein [Catenovulum sediminis]|uniref:Tryptophan halogenase family protein n=1 Tax=Catenovulum sediminis TaxID=1740262 RepID=A0ABV1RC96_9ALTE